MSIARPAPRLCASIPLSFVRTGSAGRKRMDATIALIPFIDLLMTIVVFLLMSFGTAPDTPLTADLPEAGNASELSFAPVISVDSALVAVDGRRVADTGSLMADGRVERIEGVVDTLETARRTWEILHPNESFTGRVIVQIDRAIDYRVVRKVLFSAAQAGYPNVDFAVRPAS